MTKWEPVRADRNFTVQVPLVGLTPNQEYEVEAQLRAESLLGPVVEFQGKFTTTSTETQDGRVSPASSRAKALISHHDAAGKKNG
jgi:hypothetical protein